MDSVHDYFDVIVRCKQCGSEDVEVNEDEIYIEHEFAYIETTFTCENCGNTIKGEI